MGAEAACSVRFNGRTAKGKARLETDVLQFRSPDLKLDVPFRHVKTIAAADGELTVSFSDGDAIFRIGAAAERWAEKIRNPPSRVQKIGVKPGWRASAVGVVDDLFLRELKKGGARLTVGRAAPQSDAIFIGLGSETDLGRIARLKRALKPDGAIWVIRPKGRAGISEAAVMQAGKAAGMVDVKVVSFSATHTAEKFVIPLAARTRHASKQAHRMG